VSVSNSMESVTMDREVPSLNPQPPSAESRPEAAGRQGAPFKVAYLINQYPKVSHSFVRREILAVERQGVAVERIAIRGWDAEVVDADDIAERARTHHVLKDGLGPVLRATLRTFVASPRRFLGALGEALRQSRGSDRPAPYHLMYLAEACLILEWLRASDASHVHAHFGTNSAEVAMLVHLLGGPEYSFTVHGPDEFDKAHALHLDRKIGGAKFVAAVNSYCRAQLFRRAALADWSKIKIVHCGLEEDFRASGDRMTPTKGRLVCVGRLCEQKGQLILLEAFAVLRARIGGCHLVLAGDGEMRPEIEARISALNLKDAVTITGWISSADVRKEILAAEALVLPSFQESLPVVIMEAMALRRPVISTYVAGIPELVIPGETGWLVPAASITGLVQAMEQCLSTPADTLERMGDTAYRRVVGRHDVDSEAAKLVRLFESRTVRDEIEEWQS
jgi:colanic acid/amylovoran biosynthesis glycosyltransferase